MNLRTALSKTHNSVLLKIRTSKRFYLIPIVWSFLTIFTVFIAIFTLLLSFDTGNSKISHHYTDKHTVYSAKPLVLGASTSDVASADARALAINQVFKKYKCPLYGTGEIFVKHADLNNIPYWVVASIAFQESSCGKNVPYKDGVYSYNYYGYGIWGDHMTMFDDNEHGISTMSKYMSKRFYSQGVTELCDIMKVYTPPSKGSWCNGVGFFRDQILSYQSP